jgi:hypothetical protein
MQLKDVLFVHLPQLPRAVDNFRLVSFTVSTWEWVYATNLSLLQRETREGERDRETSKRHVEEAHSILRTAILLPQRLRWYWGKIISLRMLSNLRLTDLLVTIAQQTSTVQNLPSGLYYSPPQSYSSFFTTGVMSVVITSLLSPSVGVRVCKPSNGGGDCRTTFIVTNGITAIRWLFFFLYDFVKEPIQWHLLLPPA